jgi:electron transport complex protein RnfA
MKSILALAVTSAFAANAVLQLGLGLRELVASRRSNTRGPLAPGVAMFASGLLAWPLFFYAIAPLSLAFLEPFLLFPFCSLISVCVESLFQRTRTNRGQAPSNAALSSFDGLSFGSAYLTLRYASSPAEAAAVSAGAALGFLSCALLLDSIRRRAEIEAVPFHLRGAPLILISAGLLALISLFATAALFAALG